MGGRVRGEIGRGIRGSVGRDLGFNAGCIRGLSVGNKCVSVSVIEFMLLC